MINAEEHKQLLAQIKELEKDSVNYFDVEKEFFLITSDNLASVQTKFYGYSIQRTGIYEEDNLTPEAVANLDGRGCYVYVEVKDGKITIKQDLNGCWGIYLFRHGDYFALSNSFFRLLDYVKFHYPLTVNRDYCHYLLINDLCSHAYSKTAINEIELVDRSAVIYINIPKKNLNLELIDYRENTIPLNSEEGIAILDDWVDFWSTVFRNVTQKTKFIAADLSGGFDSRMVFLLLLNSGIDLRKITIHSIKGEVHTFPEDFAIASQIAEHYGFKLNQPFPENQILNFSFSDKYNIDFYCHQTFHKDTSMFSTSKKVDKIYSINGAGGETIRNYWNQLPEEFIKKQTQQPHYYSHDVSHEIFNSVETIAKSAFKIIIDKYKLKNSDSTIIPQYLYQETRCRNHFGKGMLRGYFQNQFQLSPIIDPKIRFLKLNTIECPDNNLLMALLFVRYESNLLKFPFQGKRSITPETIAYAKKINERFPLRSKNRINISGGGYFYLSPHDKQTEKIITSGKNNPNIPLGLLQAYLKATFESSKTYGLFTAYFDKEFYNYAKYYYKNKIFGRFRYLYSVIGVAEVLRDVESSQRNYNLYHTFQYFIKQDFCQVHDEKKIADKFKMYLTARIDIKLMSTAGDFQILSLSDEKARVTKPPWFQKNGIGYVVNSYLGDLEIVAKTAVNGQIYIYLRGLDIRDSNDKSKRIPYWIDYTKLVVNEHIIFDTLTPAWHDKFYTYKIDVKAGEEIKIQVEWLPHRSDT